MSTIKRATLAEMISQLPHNPMMIQSLQLREIEQSLNGELEFINTMNPVQAVLGCSSTLGAQILQEAKALTGKQYPEFASTAEDLYRHMSDVDYIGRFSSAATATLGFLISKDEILSLAVPVGDTGVKRLTIPRDTEITVEGTTFTFQYPIEIRVQAHGGITVVYNAEKPSPVQALASNQVEWSVENYTDDGGEQLLLIFPLLQFKTTTYNVPLTFSRPFTDQFELTDQFFHCRVYHTVNGVQQEIKTTHSDQVFDPNTPTAVLKVLGSALRVSIPQIYQTLRVIGEDIRIDIMTTRGAINMNLGQYQLNSYSWKFIDRDSDDNGIYTAPLQRIKTIAAIGLGQTSGGRNELTFDQLRARVMQNSYGQINLPITQAQIQYRLEDMGYGILKSVDHVTERVFLATRRFDRPADSTLVSGVGATSLMLRANFNTLSLLPQVRSNGNRITLTPELLYRDNEGIISIVSSAEIEQIKALDPERRALQINSDNLLYSPLHYVFDINDSTFSSRPYYFGDSAITNKYYLHLNDSTALDVSVKKDSHTLIPNENGWTLRIQTVSSDEFKALQNEEVFAQLKFSPEGEDASAFINASAVYRTNTSNEYIFEFQIGTNYDVDEKHNLIINNFSIFEPVIRNLRAGLTQKFGLIVGTVDVLDPNFVPSIIDSDLGFHLLPVTARGLYEEEVTIRLGDNLTGLWNRHRAVVGSQDYVLYENNVYKTYENNVYELDPLTGRPRIVDNGQGRPSFIMLHAKGDPILDVDTGEPIIQHPAGTPMLVGGQPIIKNPRNMLVQSEILLFEGIYYFATAPADQSAAIEAAGTLVDWITVDIEPLRMRVLDLTKIYFKPLSTVGAIDAIVLNNEQRRIQAAQSLLVTYYVTERVFGDPALRGEIETSAIQVIASEFDKSVVTQDQILAKLKVSGGTEIIAVGIDGLGGRDHDVITLLDDDARLAVGKKLIALANGQLSVTNDVTFRWVNHRSSN